MRYQTTNVTPALTQVHLGILCMGHVEVKGLKFVAHGPSGYRIGSYDEKYRAEEEVYHNWLDAKGDTW